MATLQITIPDAVAARVNNAVASVYNYNSTIQNPTPGEPDIPNPQTKAQFSKQQVINFLKGIVRAHEANLAESTARQTAIDKVENEISLT